MIHLNPAERIHSAKMTELKKHTDGLRGLQQCSVYKSVWECTYLVGEDRESRIHVHTTKTIHKDRSCIIKAPSRDLEWQQNVNLL